MSDYNAILKSMGKPLILGLDLDGTLADHTQSKLGLARELGYVLEPHQTSPELIQDIISAEHYKEFQRRVYGEFSHLAVKQDSLEEGLNALKNRGWNFILVSRRGPDAHEAARQWLNMHLPGLIPEHKIFFVGNDEDKNGVCLSENVAAFVDDKLEVLQFMDNEILKVLFDPFDNWTNLDENEIKRAKSWNEIPNILVYLENKSSLIQ